MSTTPPEQPAGTTGTSRPTMGMRSIPSGARLPIPGNAEFAFVVALAWLFLRMASEGELRQELLERGLDPRAVRRAVRYGRAQDLPRPR